MTVERRPRPTRKQPRPNLRRKEPQAPSRGKKGKPSGKPSQKDGKNGRSRSRISAPPTVRVTRQRSKRPAKDTPAVPNRPISPPAPTQEVRRVPRPKAQPVQRSAPVRINAKTIFSAIFSARVFSFILLSSCIITLGLSRYQPGFYLNSFDVQGLTYVNPADIIEASNLRGAHIFTADPDSALEEMRNIPGVIAADLSINWPGTAVITIEEESPVAIWEQDGTAHWLNNAGHILPLLDGSLDLVRIRVDDSAGNNLPISIPDEFDGNIDWPAPRTRLIPPTIINHARDLASVHPRYDNLIFSASYGLTWYHPTNGWHVYFGTQGDMRVKAAVLEEVLLDMAAKDVSVFYVDVSNPEMVRVMPVAGTADSVTVISSFQP